MTEKVSYDRLHELMIRRGEFCQNLMDQIDVAKTCLELYEMSGDGCSPGRQLAKDALAEMKKIKESWK